MRSSSNWDPAGSRESQFAGEPHCDLTTRIVEEIKLGSAIECSPVRSGADYTLEQNSHFFERLDLLSIGIVDIEIRHHLPFRIVSKRCYEESVP